MTKILIDKELLERMLEFFERTCGGRCNAEYNPCWAREEADALRAVLDANPAATVREPLTDEQLRDALRTCKPDVVEALRIRWLYAKDFARAIEQAHGIGKPGEQA